jgi:DNA repair exonuclease SbcCD ATPase subunit
MRYIIILLALLVTVFFVSAQTRAQEGNNERKSYLYEWTDDSGVVHITDKLGNVPEQYRAQARKREESRKSEAGGGQQTQRVTGGPSGPEGEEETEESRKAEWQDRIREWKTRLAQAEKRYRELDQQRTELLMSWGGPAYGPIENKVKAEQIEQQMKEIQKQIDEARNMLDVVIPEEARKAGVPPGWLRE